MIPQQIGGVTMQQARTVPMQTSSILGTSQTTIDINSIMNMMLMMMVMVMMMKMMTKATAGI